MLGAHPQSEWDELLTASATACLALAKGQRVLARAYQELTVAAAREWLVSEMGYDGSELR